MLSKKVKENEREATVINFSSEIVASALKNSVL